MLEALLDYADNLLEVSEQLRRELKASWTKDEPTLFVIGTLESLAELTKAGNYSKPLNKSEIEDAIAFLGEYLGILKQATQQGSAERQLNLTLWCKDKAGNLKQFEKKCQFKDSKKVTKARQLLTTTPTLNPQPLAVAAPELPESQVALDSAFYLERRQIEGRCYEEILQPGALIRIKAPQQMGKTLLLRKVLHKAREQGYEAPKLDFQLADSTVLTNYQKFLQWFCANIGDSLELPDRLDEYWKDAFGLNKNCTRYFQKYLFAEIKSPLVLGLDNVDIVFEQTALFKDFCKLLRGWYDQAKEGDRIGDIWKKIRLVIVHSTEVYRGMDINSSPLAGVGITVNLLEFCLEEVKDLAQQHGLNWNMFQVEQLMAMVGGHPYLVQKALDCVKRQEATLEQLLKTAPTEEGIFSDHLGRHLQNLRQHPELAEAFSLCVTSREPVKLDSELTFKLDRMGLVKLLEDSVTPRCNLYRHYFREH